MKYQFEYDEIKNCGLCPVYKEDNSCGIRCLNEITLEEYSVKKPSWCPLVEVKDGE